MIKVKEVKYLSYVVLFDQNIDTKGSQEEVRNVRIEERFKVAILLAFKMGRWVTICQGVTITSRN